VFDALRRAMQSSRPAGGHAIRYSPSDGAWSRAAAPLGFNS
jgi:hypothetical protein